MDDEEKKLKINPYTHLPKEIYNVADRIGLAKTSKDDNISLFDENLISQKSYDEDIDFKTYMLDEKSKPDESNKVRRKKRGDGLNAKQRRKLFALSRSKFKYDIFKNINLMWQSYIDKAMSNFDSPSDQLQLIHADYHGAHFIVCASVNPIYVGVKGFVVQETKNTFRIINKNDKIITVPKYKTIFAFEHNNVLIKLNGTAIKTTSYGRSKLRLKQKMNFSDIF